MRDVYTAGAICVALELPRKAKQGRRVSPRKALTMNHPKEKGSPAAKLERNWRRKGLARTPRTLGQQEAGLEYQAPPTPFRFPEKRGNSPIPYVSRWAPWWAHFTLEKVIEGRQKDPIRLCIMLRVAGPAFGAHSSV